MVDSGYDETLESIRDVKEEIVRESPQRSYLLYGVGVLAVLGLVYYKIRWKNITSVVICPLRAQIFYRFSRTVKLLFCSLLEKFDKTFDRKKTQNL